jgi:hypothetical protein
MGMALTLIMSALGTDAHDVVGSDEQQGAVEEKVQYLANTRSIEQSGNQSPQGRLAHDRGQPLGKKVGVSFDASLEKVTAQLWQ